jgi:broad specificity phosphatase PhoE
MTTELLLIRHGQSEANVGASSDPDCGLTELGRQQAGRVGRQLRDYDLADFVAVTSPYRRARQTAEVIAREVGLAFAADEAVREWGLKATVDGRAYPREPLAEVVARLGDFLRRYAGRRVLVVSHAAPIAVLTHLAWGERPNTVGEFWAGIDNCCPRWLKSTCGPGAGGQSILEAL